MNDTQGFVPASITAWSGLFKAEICLLPKEEQCSECGWCVKTSSRLSPECGSCSILGFTLNKENWGVWELALFVLLSEGIGLIRIFFFFQESSLTANSQMVLPWFWKVKKPKSALQSVAVDVGHCWDLAPFPPTFLCSPTSLAPSPSSNANLAR